MPFNELAYQILLMRVRQCDRAAPLLDWLSQSLRLRTIRSLCQLNGAVGLHSRRWPEAIGRVTRLDEFSPLGRLFTLGSFMIIVEDAKMVYFHSKKYALIFTKFRVGLYFGPYIFTNSLGHPGHWRQCGNYAKKKFKRKN
jgi:hypothetical protein